MTIPNRVRNMSDRELYTVFALVAMAGFVVGAVIL